jgi:hypothetical protein
MLIPVGILIALVAHRTLMRVRAHVGPEVLNAHDAHGALGRGANLVIHVISAADAAARLGLLAVSGDLPAVLTRASGLGAGGFFVVVSGAHAGMIAHHPLGCKWVVEVYLISFGALHFAPPG